MTITVVYMILLFYYDGRAEPRLVHALKFDTMAHCQAVVDRINPFLQPMPKGKSIPPHYFCAEGIIEPKEKL